MRRWAPMIVALILVAPLTAADPPTRASLRVQAFGSTRLPAAMPTVQRGWGGARFRYAARVDRLTVHLPRGFTSVAYDLRPRRWNGRTIVFHNGHAQDVDASEHVLRWFLSRKWRVVTMAMPLAGENLHPGYADGGGLHDGLATLPRPLGMFMTPVIAVLNYTGATVMMGLSGGGWTTSVAAAIDPRIRRSYPVAGSMPRPWLCQLPNDRVGCDGDLEYRLINDYLRVYELGSGPGRRQVALYNLHDSCCFAGESPAVWAPLVRGNFRAVIDRNSREHRVTEFHLRVITSDLRR